LYYEIYPDIIFIINFLFDLILLYLLQIINRKKSKIGRMLCAAAIGGLMATIVTIFPGINMVIRFMLIYIVSSILMIEIAFGRMKIRELIIQVVILYIITYFVGGLISSIYHNTNLRLHLYRINNGIKVSDISWKYMAIIILLIIPVILVIIWLIRGYYKRNPDIYKIDLILGDKKVQANGMLDTGNCLYDPLLNKPVIIVEFSLIKQLLSNDLIKELEWAKEGLNGDKSITGQWDLVSESAVRLRLIPYQSIGKKGLLPGVRLDRIVIYRGDDLITSENIIAAIFDDKLSTKDDYHVILHKELL